VNPDLGKTAAVRKADEAAPRLDLAFLGPFAIIVAAIVTMNAASVIHDLAAVGRPISAWKPIVWEASSGLVLIALAPLALWLLQREPLTWPLRPRPFAIHLAAAIAYSFVHVVGMGALRWLAYAAAGDWYHPGAPLADWAYELGKDLLSYAGLAVGYRVCRLIRERGARETEAQAAPQVIEVRDGAKRTYVPVSDILWVEAAGNYVELRRGMGPVLHRAPLSEMERRLAPVGFVRIHRARLVNRSAIAQVVSRPSGEFAVRLATGEILAGSRRYRKAALTAA
jgi:hypothetical protein